jgi:H+/gluconate symporter-like permease
MILCPCAQEKEIFMPRISQDEIKKLPPEVAHALARGTGFVYPRNTPIILAIPEGANIEISSSEVTFEPEGPLPRAEPGEKNVGSARPITTYIMKIVGERKGWVKVCVRYDFGLLCHYVVVFELVVVLIPIYG